MIVKNEIVPNVVSYVHVMATKIWDDNNNEYGKRPATITYQLTRTITTVTVDNEGNVTESEPGPDSSFGTIEKPVGESDKWTALWAYCAAFDENGNRYDYIVTEKSVTGYGENNDILIETDESGDLVRNYQFTNIYTPATKSIKASKVWDDTDNAYGLRPTKVQFQLCCKYDVYTYNDADSLTPVQQYDGYDGPVYVDEQKKSAVYDMLEESIQALFRNNSSKFEIEVDQQGKWEKTFTGLPAYVNPIGEDKTQIPSSVYQKNGKAVKVTYYVKEYIPERISTGYNYSNFVEYKDVTNYPYIAYDIPATETAPKETSPVSREVTLSTDAADTTVPEVKLGNKLKTRDITVAKSWNDNSYMDGKDNKDTVLGGMHYNTKVTLSSSMFQKNSADYEEEKVIAKTDKNGVKFENLPIYDAKGLVIEYTVKEELTTGAASSGQIANAYHSDKTAVEKGSNKPFSQGNTQYMYDGQCTKEMGNEYDAEYLVQYNILDTLPLTAVTVVKEWDDQNNAFNLRPGSITLNLQQSSTGVTGTPTSAYNNSMEFVDVPYSTHDENTQTNTNVFPVKKTNTGGKDTWTYTYKKLLKYDASGNPYIFKITENTGSATHITAYKDPAYVRNENNNANGQIVDDVLTTGSVGEGETWDDGTHALAEKFYIQNELETRNVYVAKSWNDNDYGNSLTSEQKTALLNNLHYNVLVTLTSNQFSANTTRKLSSGTYSSYKYGEQHIIPKGVTHAVKFENLPKYDSTGTEIVYKVWETYTDTTESTSAVDNQKTYSDAGTDVTNTQVSESDSTKKYFKVADKRYGYEGSCKLITHNATQTETEDYLQYNVLNTLPHNKE